MRPEIPITVLRFFAWLSLILGVLTSFIVLTSVVATANQGAQLGSAPGAPFISVALSFAPILYGGLLWALLMVIALIAENLLDINDSSYWIGELLSAHWGFDGGRTSTNRAVRPASP